MTDRIDVYWQDDPWQCHGDFDTREEAIAAALEDLEPGDSVIVHKHDCAVRLDAPCNCDPQIIIIPAGRVT